MADQELVQALDYILNKSDEASIEVLAEAVVRRRRNMHLFNAFGKMPDPQQMADQITEKINDSLGTGMEGMRREIRQMIFRIVREHAPELTDAQMAELAQAWMPSTDAAKQSNVPSDVLLSMIEQFVSFSHGTMQKSVDESLRKEMGAWPERYWTAFPPVIKQTITDYLKNKISEKDFKSRIAIATKG